MVTVTTSRQRWVSFVGLLKASGRANDKAVAHYVSQQVGCALGDFVAVPLSGCDAARYQRLMQVAIEPRRPTPSAPALAMRREEVQPAA